MQKFHDIEHLKGETRRRIEVWERHFEIWRKVNYVTVKVFLCLLLLPTTGFCFIALPLAIMTVISVRCCSVNDPGVIVILVFSSLFCFSCLLCFICNMCWVPIHRLLVSYWPFSRWLQEFLLQHPQDVEEASQFFHDLNLLPDNEIPSVFDILPMLHKMEIFLHELAVLEKLSFTKEAEILTLQYLFYG